MAQHIYSLLAYVPSEQKFTAQAMLSTNHQYIVGFIMIWTFAHGPKFFIED